MSQFRAEVLARLGYGSATITIADAPAGQRTTLTVTAGEGSGAKTATCVIVRNPETPAETVFSLDFGNGAGGVWAGANQEWKTQTGTGASTVTYAVNNVRINNDNYGSAGKYSGASGKAYAKMFYNASTDYFVSRTSRLPAGQTNFTLAFGAIFPADDVSLTVSADGAVWKPLTYTAAPTYNTWTLTRVGFTLAQPVPKLWIRLAPTGTERAYGLNFDDIRLTTGGGGQQVDLGTGAGLRWAELPSNFETPSSDQFVHTTWTTTVSGGKRVRNYTYCYDKRRHNPVWVAIRIIAATSKVRGAPTSRGRRTRRSGNAAGEDLPFVGRRRLPVLGRRSGDRPLRQRLLVARAPLHVARAAR